MSPSYKHVAPLGLNTSPLLTFPLSHPLPFPLSPLLRTSAGIIITYVKILLTNVIY